MFIHRWLYVKYAFIEYNTWNIHVSRLNYESIQRDALSCMLDRIDVASTLHGDPVILYLHLQMADTYISYIYYGFVHLPETYIPSFR
jgi:hypothetical protein